MFESHLRDLVREENTVSAGYLGGTLSLAGVGAYHPVTFNIK